MSRELWLFTIRYPFGTGESFLESELPILARGFERVRIFPLMPEGDQRQVPKNVEVIQLFGDDAFKAASPVQVLTDLRRWNHVMRISKDSAPSAEVFTRHRRSLMSRLRQALYRERVLSARMASKYDPTRVVLYSYWTSDWATVLGLWKLDDPEVRFSSRMMGFDMYDHRATDGWQMLQAFHVQQVERVFTIARAGQEHMRTRFPAHAHKFRLSYLATTDHGIGPWAPAPALRIVSCANLVPLKRVHLLAQALAMVERPVHWTHFGEGVERPRIEALIHGLPKHITVDLKGNRPNTEILDWYKAHAADVFVHTSETEGGAPVALQEAASFGIPLIAADAGGVREIVTPQTGILLPHDLTAAQLADTLRDMPDSKWYAASTRVHVRGFWQSNFQAEEVHGRLLEQLLA